MVIAFESVYEQPVGLLDAAGLTDRFHRLDRERRRLDAELAELIDVVQRREVFRIDGHQTVTAWCRASGRWSTAEAAAYRRLARFLAAHPTAAEALATGVLGSSQAAEMARAFANPRCGAELGEVLPILLRHAERLSFAEFRVVVRRWEDLADADGAHRDHEAAHANRSASIDALDATTFVRAKGGNTDGAEMMAIFARYCDAEFRIDCAAVRAAQGLADDADVPAGKLPRTASQRAWDAMHRLFVDAASTAPGSQPPEPALEVVIDLATFEQLLADLADAADLADEANAGADGAGADDADDRDPRGDDDADAAVDDAAVDDAAAGAGAATADGAEAAGARDGAAAAAAGSARRSRVARPVDPRWWRCETPQGVLLPRSAALEAALLGHVRRVVIDAAGVVVDVGRRRRLFTGVQRQMVLQMARWCTWDGCLVPARHCQADHSLDHQHGGTTSTDNGGPRCGKHNRWKNRGYEVWLDPDGYWHTSRPDGTELG